MKKMQILLFVLAVLCLASWLGMRKPYSPSDDLPMVAYQAFDVKGISVDAGETLAQKARQWPGITAVTFNPSSELLVLSFTNITNEQELLGKIQAQTSVTVHKKVFPKPDGPQCPVPISLIAAFPTYLFWAGSVLASIWLLSLFILPFQKRFNFG